MNVKTVVMNTETNDIILVDEPTGQMYKITRIPESSCSEPYLVLSPIDLEGIIKAISI